MLTLKNVVGARTLGACLFFAASTIAVADTAAGLKALENKNYTVAYQELRAGADKGDAVAMANLGLMYARGFGITRDMSEAMQL